MKRLENCELLWKFYAVYELTKWAPYQDREHSIISFAGDIL